MKALEGANGKRLGFSVKNSETSREKYIFGDTLDELIDGLEVYKDGNFINQFVTEFSNALTEEHLQQLDKLILETMNAKEIVDYAKGRRTLSNVEDFEDTLISLNDFDSIIEAATHSSLIQNINIEKLENAVIEGGTPEHIYFFSLVNNCNFSRVKKALLETKSLCDIAYFCLYFGNRTDLLTQEDIQYIQDLVISSKDLHYIYFIAKNVDRANIDKLQDTIISSGNPDYIFGFAENVKGADIEKLGNYILKTGNTSWIKSWEERFGTITPASAPKKKRFSFFKKSK